MFATLKVNNGSAYAHLNNTKHPVKIIKGKYVTVYLNNVETDFLIDEVTFNKEVHDRPNGNPEYRYLDYFIIMCQNGDGIVLQKQKGGALYENHLGNYSNTEDAERAAVLYYMLARPERFATHLFHYAIGTGTTHEYFALVKSLEADGLGVPEEIQCSNNPNCSITYLQTKINKFK